MTQAGQVTFDPFWQVTASADPLGTPQGLDYCVETRDAADALLNRRCFGLDFFGYETQLPLDTDYFLVSLPYSASIHKVVLTYNGEELGSVEASAVAPLRDGDLAQQRRQLHRQPAGHVDGARWR